MTRISNPIDAPDLGPKENPAAGEFIFVGRLSPEKGVFLFAEAAAKLGVPATFVGDGPLKEELRARFPNARLLGWQDSENVRQAMRAARALVFPSLWFEGQPLTVLEAKALGTPVIVADQCAGRDEIEDGAERALVCLRRRWRARWRDEPAERRGGLSRGCLKPPMRAIGAPPRRLSACRTARRALQGHACASSDGGL